MEKKPSSVGKIIESITTAAILIVLVITCPSEEKMREKVLDDAAQFDMAYNSNLNSGAYQVARFLSSMLPGFVNNSIAARYDINVTHYVVFSICKMTDVQTYASHTVAFGVLGNVFICEGNLTEMIENGNRVLTEE
jgi:hypothetical protein